MAAEARRWKIMPDGTLWCVGVATPTRIRFVLTADGRPWPVPQPLPKAPEPPHECPTCGRMADCSPTCFDRGHRWRTRHGRTKATGPGNRTALWRSLEAGVFFDMPQTKGATGPSSPLRDRS